MTTQLIQADIIQYLQGNQWLTLRGYMPKYQAVLCDPPYYLGSIVKRFGADNAAPAKYGSDGVYQRASQGFMGQTWDGFDSPQAYQEWVTEWAALLLDYMHPGAVGLFFGGTRTYHRLVCGLENAGWEIYDSIISWNYSTGFPKSHNIGAGIDKQEYNRREKLVMGSLAAQGITDMVWQNEDLVYVLRIGPIQHITLDIEDETIIVKRHASGLFEKPEYLTGMERTETEWRDRYHDGITRKVQPSNSHVKIGNPGHFNHVTLPATPEAAQWEGIGTSLAPSYEPIVIARAPRQGLTYAECALQFGTGGLNIEKTRIDTPEINGRHLRVNAGRKSLGIYGDGLQGSKAIGTTALGRWPKNTLLTHHPDCTDSDCVPGCHVREMGEQSGVSGGGAYSVQVRRRKGFMLSGSENNVQAANSPDNYGDSGNAARFYAQFRYVAKSPGWERDAGLGGFEARQYGTYAQDEWSRDNMGNSPDNQREPRRNPHPTLKPISLISYLAKLIQSPNPDAKLLIPFAGSGSEMIGAQLSGWTDITGIEQSAEYIDIARARIAWWSRYDSYEDAKAAHDSTRRGQQHAAQAQADGQLDMFDVFDEPE